MGRPEADLNPAQGVTGLEKAQLSSLVSAAPSGSRAVGDCSVSPEQWVPAGFWLGPELAQSLRPTLQAPGRHIISSPV